MPTTKTYLGQACAVDFWTFATPVIVGNLTALVAGKLVRSAYKNEPEDTQNTAELAIKFGAFWTAAGFTWIMMAKRKDRDSQAVATT